MFRSLQLRVLFLSVACTFLLAGCGGGGGGSTTTDSGPQVATPVFTSTAAQNGAKIVTITTNTAGANIYYTLDGSTPTSTSSLYAAPFLVTSNVTVNAIAQAHGYLPSSVGSETFSLSVPSNTLVWSDEFNNGTGSNIQPDPTVWAYDTGAGPGNSELEDYCAWNSSASPCNAASPNSYIGTDGYLHIIAQQPSTGVYTSARLKTQGLFSFQYGRIEARIQLPEEQGMWPAFWLLGNNITTVQWPACGEMDVLERVNIATAPDWIKGSIHGSNFINDNIGTQYNFPTGQTAAGWHTYGMIWSKGKVSYYVDDPSNPYATFTPTSLNGLNGAVWPFDNGANFVILNLAVGGTWPGSPDSTTTFPAQMLVDYVRVYTN